MVTKKRVIKLTPEVRGCYGPRVWVSASDAELRSILVVLGVWPSFTLTRSTDTDYELCYELPFEFTTTQIWKNLISRMNITIEEG